MAKISSSHQSYYKILFKLNMQVCLDSGYSMLHTIMRNFEKKIRFSSLKNQNRFTKSSKLVSVHLTYGMEQLFQNLRASFFLLVRMTTVETWGLGRSPSLRGVGGGRSPPPKTNLTSSVYLIKWLVYISDVF